MNIIMINVYNHIIYKNYIVCIILIIIVYIFAIKFSKFNNFVQIF